MGRLAAELLLKRISGELSGKCQKIILPTEIVERESSGPKSNTA
jgi:DNA-binding LacI/PurR family transcriptional regulator